jgi:E3 ubiquitin-protein ligase Topors
LVPLPQPLQSQARAVARVNVRRRTEREWGRRQRREQEEADELDRAIAKRRWIYEHHLYAKVFLPVNYSV